MRWSTFLYFRSSATVYTQDGVVIHAGQQRALYVIPGTKAGSLQTCMEELHGGNFGWEASRDPLTGGLLRRYHATKD